MTNKTAGTGQYSCLVPTELGQVVLIRDGNHEGTEVYRTENHRGDVAFRFVSLDRERVYTSERCVLVRLRDCSVEDLQEPYGCDLDAPDGLALLGLDLDDPIPEGAEVIWDSSEQTTEYGPFPLQEISYSVIFDNAGGVTIQSSPSDVYTHHFADPAEAGRAWARFDDGEDPLDWDGHEEDAALEPTDEQIAAGQYRVFTEVDDMDPESSWANERAFVVAYMQARARGEA